IRFRHFIDGSLGLASLNRTCRDHRPDVSAALTTVAFDQSGPRWLGISDLIAETEGPTFISYKVARSRLDRLRFVTQDPKRSLIMPTNGGVPSFGGVGCAGRNSALISPANVILAFTGHPAVSCLAQSALWAQSQGSCLTGGGSQIRS